MIESLFNQPGYLAARKMLDVAVMRQEAIASNVRNIEVPNYKRRDIPEQFSADLNRALGSGDTAQLASLQPSIQVDTTAVSSRRDGNTVTLEKELLAMNQNQLQHTFETQLITGSLLKLRLAITGRPS